MYIGDVEITLREAIFSVTIASMLFFVGFLISTKIEHGVNQHNLEYRQAAQITDTNEFAQAMKTDVGNAFVHGKFSAVTPVSYKHLKGKYTSIYADYQKYTMHTRIVTYTVYDSKGRPHRRTRTETYWTWDIYKTDSTNSPTVRYIGSEFPFYKFNYTRIDWKYNTVKTGFNKRIKFTMIPTNFNAAAYTELRNGTVTDGTTLHQGTSIDKMYEDFTTSHATTIFWVLWGILMIVSVSVFVIIENNWMEDTP